MASGTSSAGCKLRSLSALVAKIGRVTHGHAIPLLVLRLPEFQEIAWRKGTRAARALERITARAFRAAARTIVRGGDALAHDPGSDTFLVAMLDGARNGGAPSLSDCRLTLERLAARIATQSGRRMESGWWTVDCAGCRDDVHRAVRLALERGRRERERYEFLAAVGHELRTPLASIRGYLETVLDGDADTTHVRRFLETARREAMRLGRMVDGMLEFSLLDLSPPALTLQRCDLNERVRAAVETLAPLAGSRGVTFRFEPDAAAAASIDGDACMHALLNLLDNAARYGPSNGLVRITCVCDAQSVSVHVDDDGAGFDERVQGHGLGLAIARTIAERAGGEVRLGGSPSGGTRALLRLPRAANGAER